MDAFFADDSLQGSPSRPGMGQLLATGGLYVPGEEVRHLEDLVDATCDKYGVPKGEEFKWSPRRDSWLSSNLKGRDRTVFFEEILARCVEVGTEAVAVIIDKDSSTATRSKTAAEYATELLIRQVDRIALRRSATAIIVVDRPGGGRAEEERFLTTALDVLKYGSRQSLPRQIALNPLCTTSHFIRLLQVADVLVSCATQFVAGETRFSPGVFNGWIRPLLRGDPIGGSAIAVHPEAKYANLYHWLFGDTSFTRGAVSYQQLPDPAYPYAKNAYTP
jgi:hypothetical protein